jgi:hypothetical protein
MSIGFFTALNFFAFVAKHQVGFHKHNAVKQHPGYRMAPNIV